MRVGKCEQIPSDRCIIGKGIKFTVVCRTFEQADPDRFPCLELAREAFRMGGLAACPVIACPTSVGYGASFDGIAALLAMLNSCASGVSVVNIDNGFGAGYQAALIDHARVRS